MIWTGFSRKLNRLGYLFISGSLHDLKPYRSIYQKAIKKLTEDGIITDPNQIIFIDDEEDNNNTE
ncbi:MAG: hypothetical protein WA432_01120 [Candidatus Babeliaceae bacterium]